MDEKRLKSLKELKAPAVSDQARQRAMDLAMEEYDREFGNETHMQTSGETGGEAFKAGGRSFAASGLSRGEKNNFEADKGNAAGKRPMSIVNRIKGYVSMDAPSNVRFPIAATLTGLLVLPLGLVLYQNSALTPVNSRVGQEMQVSPAPGPATPVLQEEQKLAVQDEISEAPEMRRGTAGDGAVMSTGQESAPAAIGRFAVPDSPLPMVQADAVRQGQPGNDRFASFEENAIKSVISDPVSTFSIDVDTASYAYVRRALNEGRLPDPDAVRIEEMINYFSYGYEEPQDRQNPFATQIEITPSPWNASSQLMRVGIKGYVPPPDQRQPVNLVFLIDSSGSMASPDKLPLLKRAFVLAVNQLDENDRVSIVTYAGQAGVVLEPTPASDRARILAALENLHPAGSTAGAAGIKMAYSLAEQARQEGSLNRVLLATDGDFNVGMSSSEELKRFIEEKRRSGIFLSVLGFGTGNLNDALMQTLAQNGNGNAYYIDSFSEARKVLVQEIGSTIVTIARDVKIQIEFNPALVARYRLIGYESRALERQDFNNDRVDAGEAGAGQSVTAIYELVPVGAQDPLIDPLRYGKRVTPNMGEEAAMAGERADEIGFFRLRYKGPEGGVSRLVEMPITTDMVRKDMNEASIDTRFAIAVAAFGQKLRGSVYGGDMSYGQIRQLALQARGRDEFGYRAELIRLVDLAMAISGQEQGAGSKGS